MIESEDFDFEANLAMFDKEREMQVMLASDWSIHTLLILASHWSIYTLNTRLSLVSIHS